MKKMLKVLGLSLILILGVILLTGCGKNNEKKAIIGTWTKGEGEYIFNEDGTAIMNGRMAKYSMQDKDLYIEYDGLSKAYKFTVETDNDKMKLTSEDGDISEYTRKK